MAKSLPDQGRRTVSVRELRALEERGASPELVRAARASRKRKATLKIGWPTFPYSIRWPELDCCTGQGGHGLFTGLRIWWSVRRGTWEDDWHDFGGWDDDETTSVAHDETQAERNRDA